MVREPAMMDRPRKRNRTKRPSAKSQQAVDDGWDAGEVVDV
jgi:hypothetical protein